jgi:hypothetical protein
LTVPEGAVQDVIPSNYRKPHNNNTSLILGSGNDATYIIGFDGQFSYSDLITHVEKVLLPRGYEKVDTVDHSGSSTPFMDSSASFKSNKYESREDHIFISVEWWKEPQSILQEAYESYCYCISKYK